MKRVVTILAVAGLLSIPAAVLAADEHFAAELTPEAEVPPATGAEGASGEASVTIRDDGSIDYEVSFEGLTGPPVAAHIHFGMPGEAGPVMLPLAHGPSPFSGTLTEADFTPVENGPQTYEEGLQAIRDGQTYINVHTAQNAPGEIRGQLEPVDLPPTDAASATSGATVSALLLALAGAFALILGVRRFARR